MFPVELIFRALGVLADLVIDAVVHWSDSG